MSFLSSNSSISNQTIFSVEQIEILRKKDNEIIHLQAEAFMSTTEYFPKQTVYSFTSFERVNSLVETIEQALQETTQAGTSALSQRENINKAETPNQPVRSNSGDYGSKLPVTESSRINSPHSISEEDSDFFDLPVGSSWDKIGLHLQRSLSSAASKSSLKKKKMKRDEGYYIPTLKSSEMDLFGFNPIADPFLLVECKKCHKAIKNSHFSHHLRQCNSFYGLSSGENSENIAKKRKVDYVSNFGNSKKGHIETYTQEKISDKESKKKNKSKLIKGNERKEASSKQGPEKKDKKEKKNKNTKKGKKRKKEEVNYAHQNSEQFDSQKILKGEKDFKKLTSVVEDIKRSTSPHPFQTTFQNEAKPILTSTQTMKAKKQLQSLSQDPRNSSIPYQRVPPNYQTQVPYHVLAKGYQQQRPLVHQYQNISLVLNERQKVIPATNPGNPQIVPKTLSGKPEDLRENMNGF